MVEILKEIYEDVVNGNAGQAEEKVSRALQAGSPAETILNKGLIEAMQEVGRLFEEGEYYVPEMLVSARAMQAGMAVLRPALVAQDVKPTGKVVIGTVKGDLHDIGKNLVGMMLEGAGFQIIDLGNDVDPQKFVEAVNLHKPDLLGMSALLTTTMTNMQRTIQALIEDKVRDRVKVLVGGAPLTQQYADEIGADGYASDANRAAIVARQLIGLN
jgi:5-methyltetrahydrofolate--homocysteine methyltransferase